MTEPMITLKRGRDRSVLRRHPWVFSGAVARVEGEAADGDVVSVHDAAGAFLGRGHYQSQGSIRARLLSFEDRPIDAAFWRDTVGRAVEVRRRLGILGRPATNALRLIHAEGDDLPGLVADLYAGTVVLQPHSDGMKRAVADAWAAIQAALGDTVTTCYVSAPRGEGARLHAGPPAEEITIRENDLQFIVDIAHGQKTGFFLDQRDNRALLPRYAQGRRVLNAFSYTGGFSVYALAGGASHVTSVDVSGSALALADRNVQLNGQDPERHRGVEADAMEYMKHLEDAYDLIVLDPPAFAKRRDARHQAIQAYRRINRAAFQQIAPGGIVFTFSCSQVVDVEQFRGAILAAAIDSGRRVGVLHQLHQPPDHPVSIYHPESEYLKGFVLGVDASLPDAKPTWCRCSRRRPAYGSRSGRRR